MMPSYLPLCFLFIIFAIQKIPTTAADAYTATDIILINCGASTNSSDTSYRSWESDERSSYAPATESSASTAAMSATGVPYNTVRVFHSPATYTFPVATGSKFVRLHFCSNITDFDTSRSFFSVTANAFTLLSNFSAFIYTQNSSQPFFKKEFVINVGENRQLELTFAPSPNSFAFVNGIEIVSIPNKLYFRGNDVPIRFVDVNSQIYYLYSSTMALENEYRLNVGGSRVEIQDDSGPMFREWSADDAYLFRGDVGNTTLSENSEIMYSVYTPQYIAPDIVYTTARVTTNRSLNLEWEFLLDSGFNYLFRLHFCEFNPVVTQSKVRVFMIKFNDIYAEVKADVVDWAGGARIPIFRDYVTWIPNAGSRGKKYISLSMFPDLEASPRYPSALLNGLEIFKISDMRGSLAGINPDVTRVSSPETTGKGKSHGPPVNYIAMGSAIAGLAVVGASVFFIIQRRSKVKKTTSSRAYSIAPKSSWLSSSSTTKSGGLGVPLGSEFCRCFSFNEIKAATCDFDRNFIIGKGGFGCVYRGLVDDGATSVAIKRLNPSSNQGAHEFLTEIRMLSKLRHLHLVSLIGYCDEQGEMILVYDYMAHGSLRDHLYSSENPPLSWKLRLQICLGAAKGLNYLHTGAEHAIIHRDVKSTNILLDEKWVAKISDFGLSKMGQTNDSFTHISTNVKGTFGYLDPKYLSTHQLTRKSDVYAFGVVLFEVLSGRPAVDVRLKEEQHSLAGWARYCIRDGQVDQLMDTNLMGQISAACSKVYVGIAGRCIHIQPLERPTMADVVMGLELALNLQQTMDSVEVEEGEYAGIIYGDRSQVVISMDDTNDSKGESDEIISVYNPMY